jgi:Zn-dependent protease with chaperone function
VDFFAAKADALRRSRRLEWLFAFTVVCIVSLLTLITVFHFAAPEFESGKADRPADPSRREFIEFFFSYVLEHAEPILWTAGFWMMVILVPWASKAISLARGGRIVAESMGGTKVEATEPDPLLRRLHNVVEEMAIASGIAVPAVYVLEGETSINAFAAGRKPSNAAIAVTRGALTGLSRDELQGVVAHEFSHILNGDTKLNMRMIGWVAGLRGITALGRSLLRVRSKKKVSPLIFIALLLMIVGAMGTLAGRMLQAAVCRQREWLADASAVQFTRNPTGLRNALLRIAGGHGSSLRSAETHNVAHLLFVVGFRSSLFATHPPLHARIKALGPGSEVPPPLPPVDAADELGVPLAEKRLRGDAPALPDVVLALDAIGRAETTNVATPASPAMATDPAESLIAAIGNPDAAQMAEARRIVHALPEFVRTAASSTEEARGLVLALLISRDPDEQGRQLAAIDMAMGHAVTGQVRAALSLVPELSPPLRLPAVLELLGALSLASHADQVRLANVVHRLAIADGEIDMFEFCVRRLVVKSLNPATDRPGLHKPRAIAEAGPPACVLLRVLAHHGAKGRQEDARRAFRAGVERLCLERSPEYVQPQAWSAELWSALDQIDELAPLAQRDLLRAMVATIAHDGHLVREESDLLQLACAAIGCPVPPLSALIRDHLTVLN